MKIHDLADETGLSQATIRFYEKEGLLDGRHVTRDRSNYRNFTAEAVERLNLIKKLQSVGFSLAELRETMQDPNELAFDHRRVIAQIRGKIEEIKRKRDEYEQILETLDWMLEYRIALMNDPAKARSLLRDRYETTSTG